MKEVINNQSAELALAPQRAIDQARIYEGGTQKPFGLQSIVLDLSADQLVTNPFKVSFPFKSLYIMDASDPNAYVYFKPETDNTYQSAVKLQLKDILNAGFPIAGGNFYWDAQSGKSITVIFSVEMEFRSGSQVQNTTGGVTLADGTGFTTTVTTLAAASATAALAQSFTRKVATIQNNSGASIWVGPSTVTNGSTTLGFEIGAGQSFQWRNSQALYAYSVLGGDILILEET